MFLCNSLVLCFLIFESLLYLSTQEKSVPEINSIGPPRIQYRSKNYVALKWDPYPNKKPHEKYIIKHGVKMNNKIYNLKNSKRLGVTEYRLTNLKVGLTYEIWISLYSNRKIYRISDSIEASSCNKPKTFTNFNVSRGPSLQGNLSNILVSWPPILEEYHRCMSVLKIEVSLINLNTRKLIMKIVRDSSNKEDYLMEFHEQNIFSDYDVQFIIFNNLGLMSTRTSKRISAMLPKLKDLSLSMQNSSVADITWQSLDGGNQWSVTATVHLLPRHLYKEPAGECPWPSDMSLITEHNVVPGTGQLLLHDLQAGAKYEVLIRNNTVTRVGIESLLEFQTMVQLPEVVIEQIEPTHVTYGEIGVTWYLNNCELINGALLGFVYKLRSFSSNTTKPVNSTTITIDNLLANTEYTFNVAVVNSAGIGPFSSDTVFITSESEPGQMNDLKVAKVGEDSIEVYWEPPTFSNGEIKDYQITYYTDRGNTAKVKVAKDKLTYEIKNLERHKKYVIKIRASTKVGYAKKWSNPLFVVTKTINKSKDEKQVELMILPEENTQNELVFRINNIPFGIKYKVQCIDSITGEEYMCSSRQDSPICRVDSLSPDSEFSCKLLPATLLAPLKPPADAQHTPSSPDNGAGQQGSRGDQNHDQNPVLPDLPPLQSKPIVYRTLPGDVVIKPKSYRGNGKVTVQFQRNSGPTVYHDFYLIVDTQPQNHQTTRTPCFSSLLNLKKASGDCYIAARFSVLPSTFIVGDDKNYKDYRNLELKYERNYKIFLAYLTIDGKVTYASSSLSPYTLTEIDDTSTSSVFGGSVLVALVVTVCSLVAIAAVLAAAIYVRYYRKRNRRSPARQPPIIVRPEIIIPICVKHESSEPLIMKPKISYSLDYNELINLPEAEMERQYNLLPSGLCDTTEAAKNIENKIKNRYANIIAYDHSRVILDSHPSDSHKGYINANFIDAYNEKNAYIAAQGPSKATVIDMWKMAWQNNCHRIVMLCNFLEDARLKCDRYWPDLEPMTFGEITVTRLHVEQFADFTIRSLVMQMGDEMKKLYHFHFTSWPDHGVPEYATSLLAFRRKFTSFNDNKAGPSIIHCSAGVGRTGTFIALDFLLEQMKAERKVDVLQCVSNMRQRRTNMIQTLPQYIFVYAALCEALESGNTVITCENFNASYSKLKIVDPNTRMSPLQEEFQHLKKLSKNTSHCEDASNEINAPKNRDMKLLPLTSTCRAYLQLPIANCTDYINAVFVDSYQQRDAFIATQAPMVNTLIDFWLLVFDHKLEYILMLNQLDRTDASVPAYFPTTLGETMQFGPFRVQLNDIDNTDSSITLRTFNLCFESDKVRTVKHLQLTNWPDNEDIPPHSLLGVLAKLQTFKTTQPFLIHCIDGARKTGIVAAASYIIERLRLEHDIDIYQSVKHLQTNRPQFIQIQSQYHYLYNLTMEYLKSFEIYSNFK